MGPLHVVADGHQSEHQGIVDRESTSAHAAWLYRSYKVEVPLAQEALGCANRALAVPSGGSNNRHLR